MAVLSQTSGPDSRQTRETVKLPYLWPTAKELSSGSAESPELSTLMAGAKCVFLVTSDLVDSGIDQIRQSFVSNERLIVNLVVIVYPTCLTRSHHLCDLFALSENFQNRLNIKIYAKEWDWAPAVNHCVIHRSGPSEDAGLNNLQPPSFWAFTSTPDLIRRTSAVRSPILLAFNNSSSRVS